jgi:hypothetical protein
MFKKVSEALQLNDLVKAAVLLTEICESQPNNFDALHSLGIV